MDEFVEHLGTSTEVPLPSKYKKYVLQSIAENDIGETSVCVVYYGFFRGEDGAEILVFNGVHDDKIDEVFHRKTENDVWFELEDDGFDYNSIREVFKALQPYMPDTTYIESKSLITVH